VILETLENEVAAGMEPDPAIIALLTQEGPKAIESWIDAIDVAKGEATVLATRIKELQGRKQCREQTIERMEKCLVEILDSSFNGKVKTAEVTAWTQESSTFEFEGVIPVTYEIPQPPKVDKKAMLTDLKEGKLTASDTLTITETKKSTLRIRR